MSAQLAEHYRQMPNERLLQIALYEAADLTPTATLVLNAEIEARGLSTTVGTAVDAQTRTLSQQELALLTDALREQPCSMCRRTDKALNGGIIADAKSFIFMTTQNQHTSVACPDCLSAEAKRALITTMLLGWWGFPWGPIYTIRALIHNVRTMRHSSRAEASAALTAFVRQNPGVVTALLAESAP